MNLRTLKTLKSQEGFTLAELIIVMVIIAIIAAASIGIYTGMFGSADVTAITGNISKLKADCEQYASMNGGGYTSISASALQTDGLLPSTGWTVGTSPAYTATPPNTSLVSSYYIGPAVDTGASFVIGFTPSVSSFPWQAALQICNNFANQIYGYAIGTAVPASYTALTSSTSPCSSGITTKTYTTGDSLYLEFQ